jgi:hypothetical protein
MRIASKVGILLATVGMTIGLLGSPAQAIDSGWPAKPSHGQTKYIP